MVYTVKELFRTIQGEGGQAGRVAVFCRFSGCNLWSGRPQDRERAICRFCDTDFVGGTKYATAVDLATAVDAEWGGRDLDSKFVVLTGGEPLLQVDDRLLLELNARGFEIAVETNGTVKAPNARIDWICVSPKTQDLKFTGGEELKFVFPQEGLSPEMFEHLPFKRFSLSPMDGPSLQKNTQAAIAYCMERPKWRLSLQTHKILGIR